MDVNKQDELIMKLLHYFITEEGYNPIVLHGAQNEIWLENLENSYKIVRIVSNYIHNDEQLGLDLFKTKQISKKIKKKTFCFNMKTLSIFVNLGDNVHALNEKYSVNNIDCINVKKIDDISKYRFVIDEFPSIIKDTKFSQKGFELFAKLSKEISDKSGEDARKAEDIFRKKLPIVTYILIAINILMFIGMYVFGKGSTDNLTLLNFGANYPDFIKLGEYYRLITSAFLHIGVLHLLVNMYSLYIIGSQLEGFLGRVKYLIVYLGSAIFGNLMSMLFFDGISAGASGAIFGLLGALLYFGYHYRVYLGTVVKSQIIPLIVVNLLIGFSMSGINNAAHIGGLVGGILLSMMVGIKYKTTKSEQVNGLIMTIIYTVFLVYMNFFK